jgi:hypothetical protein
LPDLCQQWLGLSFTWPSTAQGRPMGAAHMWPERCERMLDATACARCSPRRGQRQAADGQIAMRFPLSASSTHDTLTRQGDEHHLALNNENDEGWWLTGCTAVFRRWRLAGRSAAALERTYMAKGLLGRYRDKEKKMGWLRRLS